MRIALLACSIIAAAATESSSGSFDDDVESESLIQTSVGCAGYGCTLNDVSPCIVSADCVCSSNYPEAACATGDEPGTAFDNDVTCVVNFTQPVTLTVHAFDVYDSTS